ncbi:efflux RND transporter periplasmic adaptor subunit [Nitratiruptor tergarcus]|uniref:Membrane-fusion protein n=1 Tax=Nitratiruptor tergarcus DSM 16512 TaxID=1069081 RepID=A0A1W1WUT3_9BACT|nr:efflux RND transporter periplasmic adaptor subunit [Nitratiruptor tergarcus]SMC10037.1 Membrane-fusion protein [Nitratiruptor tergarcus DSM 16512]
MNVKTLTFFILIPLLFLGCAKTVEEKEIKKSKNGISIRLEGTVYPSNEKDIIAPTTGRIKQIFVKSGDRVKQGKLLAKFHTVITKFDIEKTQQELEYLVQLKKFLKHSKKHNVNLALVNIAREKLEKLSKLKSQGLANSIEYNNAKALYASSLHSKYSEGESKAEKLQFLDERIAITKNELKKLQHRLALSEIRSDIDGFVADLKMQVGDYVAKGTKLGHIVNLDKVIVKAGIAPGLIPFIKKGKKVRIDFITTPPYHVEAKISRVVMIVDPDFKRMTAEIVIPNKNYLLQPETKALVTVYLTKKEQEFIKNNFLENPKKTVYEVKSFNY